MTDETPPGSPPSWTPPPWTPPPAPTPPPSPWAAITAADLAGPLPGATTSPRRRPVGVIAVSIAVVAILISGVATVVALTAPDTNSPGSAVTGLLTAAGNGDVLGILDHIDPPERDAVTGFVTNGVADLQRLGILSSATDLHHVAGFSASFANVQTSTSDLRPDLTAVRITGGTVHGHVDPAQLPLGSFVRAHAGSGLAKAAVEDVTAPLHFDGTIVTIRRGDTWYVSLGYTAAEAARAAAKMAMPNPQDAVPAVGAASPKDAVDAFLRALARLDVRRLIELTPPDEMAALHDYAPLFLPDVATAVARAQPFNVTITTLDLSSQSDAGGQLVTIDRLGLRAAVGQVTIDLAPGSRCPTVTGTTSVDLSSLCGATRAKGAGAAAASLPPGLSGALKSLGNIRAHVGLVTVERGGAWYISPTRTVLDDLESVLHVLPSNFLDQLVTAFNPAAILGGAHIGALTGPNAIASLSGGASTSGSWCTETTMSPDGGGQPASPPVTIPCPSDTPTTGPGG